MDTLATTMRIIRRMTPRKIKVEGEFKIDEMGDWESWSNDHRELSFILNRRAPIRILAEGYI